MFKLQKGSRSVYQMFMIENGEVFPDEYHAKLYMNQYELEGDMFKFTVKFSACPVNKQPHIKEGWQMVDHIRLYGAECCNTRDEQGVECRDIILDPYGDLNHETASALFKQELSDCHADREIASYDSLIEAFVQISQRRASYKNQVNKMKKV